MTQFYTHCFVYVDEEINNLIFWIIIIYKYNFALVSNFIRHALLINGRDEVVIPVTRIGIVVVKSSCYVGIWL